MMRLDHLEHLEHIVHVHTRIVADLDWEGKVTSLANAVASHSPSLDLFKDWMGRMLHLRSGEIYNAIKTTLAATFNSIKPRGTLTEFKSSDLFSPLLTQLIGSCNLKSLPHWSFPFFGCVYEDTTNS